MTRIAYFHPWHQTDRYDLEKAFCSDLSKITVRSFLSRQMMDTGSYPYIYQTSNRQHGLLCLHVWLETEEATRHPHFLVYLDTLAIARTHPLSARSAISYNKWKSSRLDWRSWAHCLACMICHV